MGPAGAEADEPGRGRSRASPPPPAGRGRARPSLAGPGERSRPTAPSAAPADRARLRALSHLSCSAHTAAPEPGAGIRLMDDMDDHATTPRSHPAPPLAP